MPRPCRCRDPLREIAADCPTHGHSPEPVNLPDRAHFGDADIPLSAASTAALAFALGYAVARPVDANQFGPFCAMVEELQRRPVTRPDSRLPTTEMDQLMTLLPPDLSRRIAMLYQAQRGQRWAQTGQRHPKSGKS